MLMRFLKFLILLPRRIVAAFIQFYQKNFSPDHSARGKNKYPFGYCRYTPTCSEYAKESVSKHGVVLGGVKALWRVFRCNPWSKGGWDPP